jgi:hypothetical protein
MCLYSFFSFARSGLPIHPPTQTNNNQTLIQKLHSFSCCCYCCMEYKAFHLLREEEKWIRESSEEIYICIIFCCFKRQIKFYLFLCSNEFPVFLFCVCWEIRDIYSFGLVAMRMKRRRRGKGKSSWRRESNLFVRCLYDSINPPN